MIMREKGNDFKGSKINSRKWVGEECGVVVGNDGEGWKSIAVSTWRMSLGDAVMRRFLVSPYGIFEILMERSRDGPNPKLRHRVGTTGKTGSYATLNIMVESIGGVVGNRPSNEANEALRGGGLIAIPNPEYGYLMGDLVITWENRSQHLH